MKRIIFSLLTLLISISSHAFDFEVDGIYYSVVSITEQTAGVAFPGEHYKDKPYSGDISIPEYVTYNNHIFHVTAILSKAFYNAELSLLTLPNSITSIQSEAFDNCSVPQLIIPNEMREIDDYSFSYCKIPKIILNDSITKIGTRAFRYSNISAIEIPKNVKEIGSEAFSNTPITSITIPPSVEYIGSRAFDNCKNLHKIILQKSSSTLKFGLSFINDEKYPTVYLGFFHDCDSLSLLSIQRPYSVEKTHLSSKYSTRDPFDDIKKIDSLLYGNDNNFISPKATKYLSYECDSISRIYVPNTLKYLVIGKDTRYIDNFSNGFQYCDKLDTIRIKNPNIVSFYKEKENTFNNLAYLKSIVIVPKGCSELYKKAPVWKLFWNIKEEEEEEGEEAKQCDKPIITYSDGKLYYSCSTPNVTYHPIISCPDVKTEKSTGTTDLIARYDILCYATADGYLQSGTATASLYWLPNSDATNNINTVETRGIVASTMDGVVTLSGLNTNEVVYFYSIDGQILGKSIAYDGVASYATSANQIIIAKFGNSNIKILVK